jgi:hypothetical protein
MIMEDPHHRRETNLSNNSRIPKFDLVFVKTTIIFQSEGLFLAISGVYEVIEPTNGSTFERILLNKVLSSIPIISSLKYHNNQLLFVSLSPLVSRHEF